MRNPDMMIWLLEYGYSATTQQGRLRIAFTRTQADLENPGFVPQPRADPRSSSPAAT